MGSEVAIRQQLIKVVLEQPYSVSHLAVVRRRAEQRRGLKGRVDGHNAVESNAARGGAGGTWLCEGDVYGGMCQAASLKLSMT
jgi:hypothetical protein